MTGQPLPPLQLVLDHLQHGQQVLQTALEQPLLPALPIDLRQLPLYMLLLPLKFPARSPAIPVRVAWILPARPPRHLNLAALSSRH